MLGVRHEDGAVAIKAAYRKLIREHHPDLLLSKGLPAELLAVATRKTAAINEAYEQLAKVHGIK
ncbi:MAG: DnaJ domain-containing protein [Alphaproteobacteria bacterium]|nr:DnaJ domain-containing protein [Alphaproteobacteria bacterium]